MRKRRCPFADAVLAEGGHLVCALHRGLTLGLLDATEPDAHLAELDIRDPIAAGSRVLVRGLPPSPAVTGRLTAPTGVEPAAWRAGTRIDQSFAWNFTGPEAQSRMTPPLVLSVSVNDAVIVPLIVVPVLRATIL